jgi:N-acyl-L-homoserine lactone synthetase
MVLLINQANRAAFPALVRDMHADRKRVFVDILRWDLPHDERGEYDRYDDDFAEYLVVQDRASGEHLASIRLLRTDRPHLLGEVFPHLCERGVPRGPRIREATRLCISPRRRAGERLQARNLLIRSMVEYALMTGIEAYTGVADMAWLTQILSAGWDCRPLGPPRVVSGCLTGALIIHIQPATLNLFTPSWRCQGPPLRLVEFETPMAA